MPIFVMFGHDGPEGLSRRPAVRPQHLEHLRTLDRQGRIQFAGPMFADDGETPVGSVVVFEAPDLEVAQAHCAHDPYVLEGVFGDWQVRPILQVFPES